MTDSNGLNFIDFLTYGAIGIALALAILAYRLLSKEQEREHVREPMLKSIRNYFILSIVLSLFFGITEVVTMLVDNGGDKRALEHESIEEVWEAHLKEFPDESAAQKKRRIEKYIELGLKGAEESCDELKEKCEQKEEQIKKLENGFYPNIVKLRAQISQFGDNNINIDFKPESKGEVYTLLEKILISLDVIHDTNQSVSTISQKWKELKSKWSLHGQKYIYHSDIPQLVRTYLDKFHPK